MMASRRSPYRGRTLAAGALLVLIGCQQVPSRIGPQAVPGSKQAAAGDAVTPSQEADVLVSMGRIAEQQGHLDQAMVAYREALSRDSRRADAYLRLAVLHDKQGKFRESAELYRKALASRPGDPDVFCDMGYSYYLQRRWAESEMSLRQAIAVDRDHRRAHNNLALLLVRDNRLEDALAEFGRAGSSPAQAHANLAFALTMERRLEPAQAEYQRALALDPSSQIAKDRLRQLNALLARLDRPQNGATRDAGRLTTADPPQNGTARDAGALATTAAAAVVRPALPNVAPAPPTASVVLGQTPSTRVAPDPSLMRTAATVAPPRRDARILRPMPLPPIPKDDPGDFWAQFDATTAGARSRSHSDARANTPKTSPGTPPSHPQTRNPRPRPAAGAAATKTPKSVPSRPGTPPPAITRPRVTVPAATDRPDLTPLPPTTPTRTAQPA